MDRHFARMSRWLAGRGIRCELLPAAKEHLLRIADGEPRRGAVDLMRAHRNEVEFPLADLLVSRALQPGGAVQLDHREGEAHLHFAVTAPGPGPSSARSRIREVPVGA